MIDELHTHAMNLCHQSDEARKNGQILRSHELLRAAFNYEKRAATVLRERPDKEPSRSILFRGAACLAYDCALFDEALALISIGISGNPPIEIEQELQHLKQLVKRRTKIMKEASFSTIVEVDINPEKKIDEYAAEIFRKLKRKHFDLQKVYCPSINQDVYFSNKKIRSALFDRKHNPAVGFTHEEIGVFSILEDVIKNSHLIAKFQDRQKQKRPDVAHYHELRTLVKINGFPESVEVYIKEIKEGSARRYIFHDHHFIK